MGRRLPFAALLLLAGALAARADDAIRWPEVEELTRLERRGREVYRAETCFLCHGPDARAQAPDLLHPLVDRSPDWLLAHLHDPRAVHPGSPMPASPHLFADPDPALRDEVAGLIAALDTTGDGRVAAAMDAAEAWAEDPERVARTDELDVAGLSAPPASALQTRGGQELWPDARGARTYEDRWVEGEAQGDGVLSLRDARPAPTEAATALVAYVRRLGASSRRAAPQAEAWPAWKRDIRGSTPPLLSPLVSGSLPRARASYLRHCATCHGDEGRGDGAASGFLDTPPTDLVRGPFKYRSTGPGEDPLRDDVLRTVARGLPGSGMPAFDPQLDTAEQELLVSYVLSLRAAPEPARGAVGEEGPPRQGPLPYVRAPRTPLTSTQHEQLVLRGRAVFVALECSRCHGTEGRGDGPDAVSAFLDGRRIRARDFRPRDADDVPAARMRAGAAPEDLHRTLMTGLDLKGMPGVYLRFQTSEPDLPLFQPLKDVRLLGGMDPAGRRWPGVGVRPLADGPYAEVLDALRPSTEAAPYGDDWALVAWLLHMMRTEDEVRRGVRAWPPVAGEGN